MNLLRIGILEVLHQIVAHLLQHGHQLSWDAEGKISLNLVLSREFLGLHLWEEEHFLDSGVASEQHHQAVYTDADARSRGHAILERAEEVLVDEHCFVVTLVSQAHLFDETLFLVDGVVQL